MACNCNDCASGDITRYHYRSDFTIVLSECESMPFISDGHDFTIAISSGKPSKMRKSVTFTREDGVLGNGAYMLNGLLHLPLDSHGLPCGQLWASLSVRVPDDSYEDAYRDLTAAWPLPAELTAEGPAEGTVVIDLNGLESQVSAALADTLSVRPELEATASEPWRDLNVKVQDALEADTQALEEKQAEVDAEVAAHAVTKVELKDTQDALAEEEEWIAYVENALDMLGVPSHVAAFDITDREEFKQCVEAARLFKEWFYSTKEDGGSYINTVATYNESTYSYSSDWRWEKLKFLPYVDVNYKTERIGQWIGGLQYLQVFPNYWDWSKVEGCDWWFSGTGELSGTKLHVFINIPKATSLCGVFNCARALESVTLVGLRDIADMHNIFYHCTNLANVTFYGDLSNVSTIAYGFDTCEKMKKWDFSTVHLAENVSTLNICYCFYGNAIEDTDDIIGLPWEKATYIFNLFQNCTNLVRVGDLDMPLSYQWTTVFGGCTNLKTVGNLTSRTGYAAPRGDMFKNCTSLERIESITFGYTNSSSSDKIFYNCTALKYCLIKNLGQSASDSVVYVRMVAKNWGADSDENLQSLVDSFVNNTYDRVAAGFTTACVVYLHADQLARLTDAQKAQATAKGYTFTSVTTNY